MASEDNVVKLKHLRPFVNGLSIPNGDNAVRLKHLVSLASAIADETVPSSEKPTPNLAIGSWSAVDTVYSAPVSYDGDGALSVNVGSISNGVLTVNDDDGIFSGVLTASAGESYAPAVASFSYNTNTVTISGGETSIPQSIVTALGSVFVPAVDEPDDFLSYADGNIQLFDSRLRKILYESPDYRVDRTNNDTFQWGNFKVQFGYDSSTSVNYIKSSNAVSGSTINTLSLGNNNSTVTIEPALIKLSETAMLVYRRRVGNKRLSGITDFAPFNMTGDGLLTAFTVVTICAAGATLSSGSIDKHHEFRRSILNPNAIIALQCNETLDAAGNATRRQYYHHCYDSNGRSSTTERSETVEAGIWTSTGKNSSVDSDYFIDMYNPDLSFDGDSVTIAKGSTARQAPLLFYEKRIRNSSGTYTTGGDYVVVGTGYRKAVPTQFQLTSISGGVASTVNAWLEDDDNVILGLYPSEAHTDCYAVTYKPGTYPKSSWLDDAFTVWDIDSNTPRFIKTTKTLKDVLGGELPTKLSPNLHFTAGDKYVDVSSIVSVNTAIPRVVAYYDIDYLGSADRKVTFSGNAPWLVSGNYSSGVTAKRLSFSYSAETTKYRTGSSYCTLKASIAGNDKYAAESVTITITGCYNEFMSVNKSYTPK